MTSNPTLETIYGRKSVRSYSDDPVSDKDLKELVKAGFHAANGVNAQALRFAVVSNREKLREYSDYSKPAFLASLKANGIESEYMEKKLTTPDLNIFCNAPSAVFIFAGPEAATPVEDASLAAGNIMLAARSMGLGTCWIGFAAPLDGNDGFRKENNVPDDCRLLASIIVGHPTKDREPTPRKEPVILNWLR
ncbi:MAG: nitroreductase family protein [Candidatus Methanomethylophilaceae archaeon]|jgi:nitroreductase|nr:nitroreductase family protein [Candidatus Methanomethylophilaceae archaeon]NLF34122.1 nitroreductase family protein [Thermoplasmatales archaeon]